MPYTVTEEILLIGYQTRVGGLTSTLPGAMVRARNYLLGGRDRARISCPPTPQREQQEIIEKSGWNKTQTSKTKGKKKTNNTNKSKSVEENSVAAGSEGGGRRADKWHCASFSQNPVHPDLLLPLFYSVCRIMRIATFAVCVRKGIEN